MLHIEKPKHSTKKLLEVVNQLSKAAVYTTNIQKPVSFLYAKNELKEREIRGKNRIHNSHTQKKSNI